MLNKKFSPKNQTAFEARYEAQKIAFGPGVFHCARYAWKHGILAELARANEKGLSVDELEETGRWSRYALKLILETCLSAGILYLKDGRYFLDKTGFIILKDRMTQINFDFMHDICYQGLSELATSLKNEKPEGLKYLGNWPTLYEGLSSLKQDAKKSWFDFDNYYSDTSFQEILPDVFATRPQKIMDVGTNTGKFAKAVLQKNADIELSLVDLPQQLAMSKATLEDAGIKAKVNFVPVDLLNHEIPLPKGMHLVWMSQLLSCFAEESILSILKRAAASLTPDGQLLIMDTFWDRQQYDIASYCLINTSPYFTTIASGNSKIYESEDYIRLCNEAGLELVSIRDNIGFCHSLLRFAKKQNKERTG